MFSLMQVPVDLVIDHSVQVDVARSENAVQANMNLSSTGTRNDLVSLNGDQMHLTICLLSLLGQGLSTR